MPEKEERFTYHDLGNGIYNIDAPFFHFQSYLVTGKEKALLIDTGAGIGSIRETVEQITRLPVTVVNTHGHPDHCGGNAEFSECYMNPADLPLFHKKTSYESRYAEFSGCPMEGLAQKLQLTPADPLPLTDGREFDLGGRVVRTIFTPGHTVGSVGLYDAQTGFLFAGDTVLAGNTALIEPEAASMKAFLESLRKLEALSVQAVYGGHLPAKTDEDCIRAKRICAEKILSGEKGEPLTTRMGSGYVVSYEGTGVHYAEFTLEKEVTIL